ncbi:PIK3R4 kinase-related protein [Besnoitia besnoiti]|uniref:PIK3R4 kinase-related protein n=1 Tax=Besnoitia besnoiti TaxID=94643 RepID=A0A2A9MP08_BESBE|nr:PIK3R4 kinase-related protein [Besnoitia besnoiti]PFH37482.1 PIK3R4 kinase-related protein [Besnoitia besnoiti]
MAFSLTPYSPILSTYRTDPYYSSVPSPLTSDSSNHPASKNAPAICATQLPLACFTPSAASHFTGLGVDFCQSHPGLTWQVSTRQSIRSDTASTSVSHLSTGYPRRVPSTMLPSTCSHPSSAVTVGRPPKLTDTAAFAVAQSNAAAAATQAAHSAGLLLGRSQARAAGIPTSPANGHQRANHGMGTHRSAGICGGVSTAGTPSLSPSASGTRANAPPSLSSLLLASPVSPFSASLPASPCSQPPVRRSYMPSFSPSLGNPSVGKSPTSGSTTTRLTPTHQKHSQFPSAPVSARQVNVSGGAGGAVKTPMANQSPPKELNAAARPGESQAVHSKASARVSQQAGTKAPTLLTSASASSRKSDTRHTDLNAQKRDGLASSWFQTVCESAAVDEEKVRRCCCNAPIQPSVLQKHPAELEGRVIYSNTDAIIRGVEDATRAGVLSQLLKHSTSPDWDASPSLAVETLQLDKLLQSAIYGAVFRANLHRSQAKPRPDKRACGRDGNAEVEEKNGDNIRIETVSEMVAVKVLSLELQLNASPSLQEDFLSELKFFPYMRNHPNMLTPYRVYVDAEQQLLFLVFPFAEYEDLFEVLKKRKQPFTEEEVRWLCRQLFDAVLELHRRGIGMRDLSLENVLIFRCPRTGLIIPKLTDPGQAVVACPEAAARARASAHPRTSARGSSCPDPGPVLLPPDKIFGKSFRPPEVYRQCRYDPYKVDSFCLGWMVYYLLTKHQLFQRAVPSDENWRLLASKDASDLLELLGKKNGAVLSVDGLDFTVQLLEEDPARRLSVRQALRHPFMTAKAVTPVYADRIFPNDPLSQQQHLLKQQHSRQLLFEKQQRLHRRLTHQRRLQFMQQEQQRQQQREALQTRCQEKNKISPTEEVSAPVAKRLTCSNVPSLTLKPSMVKQEQRVRLTPRRQVPVNGTSVDSASLCSDAVQRASTARTQTSDHGVPHASHDELRVAASPDQRTGITNKAPCPSAASNAGNLESGNRALVSEESALLVSKHAKDSAASRQAASETGASTARVVKAGDAPARASVSQEAPKREAIPAGEGASDAWMLRHHASATLAVLSAASTSSGGAATTPGSVMVDVVSKSSNARANGKRSKSLDVGKGRGPSSRSTDTGTSEEASCCGSDTDSSYTRGSRKDGPTSELLGRLGKEHGLADAKTKVSGLVSPRPLDSSLSSTRARRPSSHSGSPQKSTRHEECLTGRTIVCTRGSLAIAATAVASLLPSAGSRKAGQSTPREPGQSREENRRPCTGVVGMEGHAGKNSQSNIREGFSPAQPTVKSHSKAYVTPMPSISVGESSGAESAGSETRKVIATRRSSRQSVAAMIEKFQQMTSRSIAPADRPSSKGVSVASRLFRRMSSPRVSLSPSDMSFKSSE